MKYLKSASFNKQSEFGLGGLSNRVPPMPLELPLSLPTGEDSSNGLSDDLCSHCGELGRVIARRENGR